MFDALVNPNEFFRGRAENPSLVRPALVVLAVAVVGAVSAGYGSMQVQGHLPAAAQSFGSISLGIGLVAAVVGPFLGWVVFALLYYGISGFFGGEGSYRDTLALAGYGYLPRVVGAVVVLALTILTYQQVPPGAGYQAYIRAVSTSPYATVSTVLSWVFVAWQGFVTMYAVKHARSLDLRAAAISVWVPVCFYLLLLVGSYVVSNYYLSGGLP